MEAPAIAPLPTTYQPDPQILSLSSWLGDRVAAADFPETILRFRNDRAAAQVGLAGLDDAQWIAHFGRFAPLPGNLPQPLALRYHGHQFQVYNPDLGDGRGFLFAQMRDDAGRLMDLGTKGSGTTPWSRAGDGRLTLKGAMREILATEMLEALGVNTSRTFSVIETGEALQRGDEPSPTRSAVMVRLSHGHIRIGTFQRLLALQKPEEMRELIDYCLAQYPGPMNAGLGPAAQLLNQVVERLADLAAQWMVAGFVHGVLNTDNMNISGESFDYGPWRWLPRWDPQFTAAYFDHQRLYAYGRQPQTLHWNCGQLAVALRLVEDAPPLIAALERFPELYRAAIARRWCWRLGVAPRGVETDSALIAASERAMVETAMGPDAFFFVHRGARNATGALAEALAGYQPVIDDHPYWADPAPVSMVIEEVEAIWAPIAQADDWSALDAKIAAIRRMGDAYASGASKESQMGR
ncbi:protein adenylyltransferase SelO family protein [Novosphingobium sp.]|uniref:protein adenylyltransferase SelO family protein n=1 Tax=Novosphingobium sp. TaxID=1874826 RepID=UPI003D09B406